MRLARAIWELSGQAELSDLAAGEMERLAWCWCAANRKDSFGGRGLVKRERLAKPNFPTWPRERWSGWPSVSARPIGKIRLAVGAAVQVSHSCPAIFLFRPCR